MTVDVLPLMPSVCFGTGVSYASKAGLGKITPNDLRKTFAKHAHLVREPLEKVQDQPRPRLHPDQRALPGAAAEPARCALLPVGVGWVVEVTMSTRVAARKTRRLADTMPVAWSWRLCPEAGLSNANCPDSTRTRSHIRTHPNQVKLRSKKTDKVGTCGYVQAGNRQS